MLCDAIPPRYVSEGVPCRIIMKKIKKIEVLIVIFIIPVILSGCMSIKEGDKTLKCEKDFGTYEIINGWIEEKTHSTGDVSFYIEKGTENDNPPNNIAVSEAKNKFKKSQHEEFKEAIMAQVSAQMPENSDAKVEMDGVTTKNKNIVYIVTIEEKEMESKFYYIVGECRFVMIQTSRFNENKDIYKVSDHIAESFVWNEK